jgi:tetratricopeptide (TPR) repeat protein
MHTGCTAALLALILGFAPEAFAQQNRTVDPGRITELEGRMRANYVVRYRICLFYVPLIARLENDNSPRDLVAHAELAQACWNAENDAMVGVALARAWERLGDTAAAATAMDAARARFPQNAVIYAGLAGQRARAGDMEGANTELDRAIELGPPRGDRDPDNWTTLSLALLDGDALLPLRLRIQDEVLARAERRRNRGEKVRALTARARVLAEAERHSDAIADLERALPLTDDSNRATVLHLRARSQRALGNLDAGRADFAAALAASPQVAATEASLRRNQTADAAPAACRTAARKSLGLDTIADDDVDAMLAAADECVASGQTAVGLALRASERSRLGDRSEALALVEQALAADPNYAYAYVVRASTLSATGQHAEARAALDRAIELDAGNARFYMLRAAEHISLADRPAARADQERALQLDPSFSNRRDYIRNLSAMDDHRCALAAIDAIDRDDVFNESELWTWRAAEARHVNRLPRDQRACTTPVAYGSALEF